MIFPLAATPLSVVVNGKVVRSYNAPFVRAGHVMAPLDPFVTAVAASIEYSGGTLVVRRADRFAQVPMPLQPHPAHFQSTFVEIAPLLRTLGIRVDYDAARRAVIVQTPPVPLATPTPFNPAVPFVAPTIVFTPVPAPTPRPIVSGAPSPRRTPLPVATSVPRDLGTARIFCVELRGDGGEHRSNAVAVGVGQFADAQPNTETWIRSVCHDAVPVPAMFSGAPTFPTWVGVVAPRTPCPSIPW